MRYSGTFLLLALIFLGFSGGAQAATDTDTKTKTSQYQSKEDSPELKTITWGAILEQSVSGEGTSKSAPADDRERSLSKWRGKQSHLWDALPEGAFTINASAYTAAADECGKSDGITASGVKVSKNRTLACPPAYPFGAKIAIKGYGVYTCEDRGGAIKGNHFDVYVETKREAFAFGRRNLLAEVVK
jgi:3D (Asp-Asp-Asp) domain-containing protein